MKLTPDPANPNRMENEDKGRMARALAEFGDLGGIVINRRTGFLIGGHQRASVMPDGELHVEDLPAPDPDGTVARGWLEHVGRRYAVRVVDWDEEKAHAAMLAANRFGRVGKDDAAALKDLLEALDTGARDMDVTGYTAAAIEELMTQVHQDEDKDAEPQVDRAEDLRKEWKVDTGQVWQCGVHRLMCADSTNAEDVARLMGGENADLCFTSPPYAQQRDYTAECKAQCFDWDGLMRGVFGNLPMADAGQVLVNLGLIHRDGEWIPYWESWIEWMREHGWRRFGWYVWDQGFGLPGDWNGRFAPSHEFVFHFNQGSIEPQKFLEKKPENIKAWQSGASTMRGKDGKCKAFTNPGASAQPNKIPESVIRINRMHGGHDIDHPAIFPVELPAYAMQSWPGVVYEPFCGSGTTLIAAEQLGRKCYAMEISPAYVAVSLQRFKDATGKIPELIHA